MGNKSSAITPSTSPVSLSGAETGFNLGRLFLPRHLTAAQRGDINSISFSFEMRGMPRFLPLAVSCPWLYYSTVTKSWKGHLFLVLFCQWGRLSALWLMAFQLSNPSYNTWHGGSLRPIWFECPCWLLEGKGGVCTQKVKLAEKEFSIAESSAAGVPSFADDIDIST